MEVSRWPYQLVLGRTFPVIAFGIETKTQSRALRLLRVPFDFSARIKVGKRVKTRSEKPSRGRGSKFWAVRRCQESRLY
jgi:hypothetical protein